MNSTNRNLNKKDSKLPIWVEILFVQIGLPDTWLKWILNKKKSGKRYINENKKPISIILLIITLAGYLYPLVKQSKNHNLCVESSKDYIKDTLMYKSVDGTSMQALSNRFCNGGDL